MSDSMLSFVNGIIAGADDGIPHLAQDDKIISRIIEESKQFDTQIELRDNLGHITISKNWPF